MAKKAKRLLQDKTNTISDIDFPILIVREYKLISMGSSITLGAIL